MKTVDLSIDNKFISLGAYVIVERTVSGVGGPRDRGPESGYTLVDRRGPASMFVPCPSQPINEHHCILSGVALPRPTLGPLPESASQSLDEGSHDISGRDLAGWAGHLGGQGCNPRPGIIPFHRGRGSNARPLASPHPSFFLWPKLPTTKTRFR